MPQATDELRAEWPGGDQQAIDHLEAKGFIPTRDFQWIRPYKDYVTTSRDESAILYLIDEWDYGGLVASGVNLAGNPIETPDCLTYQQPQLTAAEQYILGWLAEESAEVTKMAVGKTLRFGFRVPGRMKDGEPDFSFTPENELHNELGDLLAAIELGFRYGIFQRSRVMAARQAKIKKVLGGFDNLGRPLAPPLPNLPIHGPDGEIWEPKDGVMEREVTIFTQNDNQMITNHVVFKIDVKDLDTKKKKKLWRRILNWRTQSKTKNDDMLDFG